MKNNSISGQSWKINPLKRGARVYWVALLTVGAAIIHFMGAQGQLSQSFLLAALLIGCAVVQAAIALAIVAAPTYRLLVAIAVVNGVMLLLWVLSHTIGLPIGLTLWRPEPLNIFDFFLIIQEGLAELLLLLLLTRRSGTRTPKVWKTALGVLPALLLVSIMTTAGTLSAVNDVWFASVSTIHISAGQKVTLAYCTSSSGPLSIDISKPRIQPSHPAPMVFYIHGGGGIMGDRQLIQADGNYLTQLRNELNERGFVVGSIDYRLAPLYSNKYQIEDAKCAVRFLRAHATELGINPQHIGVYGTSQGGYLAAMLGTTGPEAGFDKGQYLDQSSRVQAVVDMDGPANFTNLSGSPSWVYSLGQFLIGDMSISNKRAYSPVTYVAPGDPPFLIMHGTDDFIMAPHQSQDLAQRLQAAGVPTTLVLVQHGGDPLLTDTPNQQPTSNMLVHMISDFFASTLAA